MKRLGPLSLALAVVAALAAAPAAHAQPSRTWISGTGSDSNPCSRVAPCATFAGAFHKTAAGGEISVLSPGGFGAVTITKSITLNGDGNLSGISVSFTQGIVVNAGSSDRVVIRNLAIHGNGQGTHGIRYLNGKVLVVENCLITGFTGRGIDASLSSFGNLLVKDTTIANVQTGVRLTGVSQLARAALDNVRISSPFVSGVLAHGVEVAANGQMTISDSVISGHSGSGVLVNHFSGVANLEGNQIAFNDGAGVSATASGATIRLSNNEIYNNTKGVNIAPFANVTSTGGNRVEGNGSTDTPALTFTL